MSYPSFSSFVGCLRAQLRHKAAWLAEESKYLAKCLVDYGRIINLETADAKTLYLCAYLKNTGALYLSREALETRVSDAHQHSSIKSWQLLSAQIAREAELSTCATILETYYQRGTPEDYLAGVFQVVNVWAACRCPKGYRGRLDLKETRIVLTQRANLNWSDPALVEHFLSTFPENQNAVLNL
jgi:response regulator RpfG family c-di-GMP phosphodiesterase